MKVYVTKTQNGYCLEIENDNGEINVTPITQTAYEKKTGINWLVLPENPMNRKLINPKRLIDKDRVELTFKESVKIENPTPRKGLEEYLEGDDKVTYLTLVEKAKKNREEAMKKPKVKTKDELMKEIEELKATIAKLEGGDK